MKFTHLQCLHCGYRCWFHDDFYTTKCPMCGVHDFMKWLPDSDKTELMI